MTNTELPEPLTTLIEAKTLVDTAIKREPLLHIWGIGSHPGYPGFKIKNDGEDLATRQQRLYSPESLRAVAYCNDWISRFQRRASVNPHFGSYQGKHCVERWLDNREYISNGCFLAACIGAGLSYRREVDWTGQPTLNATIGLSKRLHPWAHLMPGEAEYLAGMY
jgi:hypothetical protein